MGCATSMRTAVAYGFVVLLPLGQLVLAHLYLLLSSLSPLALALLYSAASEDSLQQQQYGTGAATSRSSTAILRLRSSLLVSNQPATTEHQL